MKLSESINTLFAEDAKSIQDKNKDDKAEGQNRKESSHTDSKGTEVLKSVGYDDIKKNTNIGKTATPPDKDPKAKSSSSKKTIEDGKDEKEGYNKVIIHQDQDSHKDDEEEKKKMKKEELDQVDHLQAIFEGNDSLSEEFKEKTRIVFEAALNESENRLREEIIKEYDQFFEEYKASLKENLEEKITKYIDYVAEQWMEDNQLEIEAGLRTEITESFMSSLANLFKEHNINVPEGKEDLVEQLSNKVSELEEQLNLQITKNIDLNEQVETARRADILADVSKGLSDSEFEKLVELSENIEFKSEEEFKKNAKILAETYFKKNAKASVIKEEVISDNIEGDSSRTQEELSEQVKPSQSEGDDLAEQVKRFMKARN